MTIKRLDRDQRKSIFRIYLEKAVAKNYVGQLDISFEGKMETSSTEAFFKTSYIDENEQERFISYYMHLECKL